MFSLTLANNPPKFLQSRGVCQPKLNNVWTKSHTVLCVHDLGFPYSIHI